MTRKALARRIAEVLFNEPATRRGAGAGPTGGLRGFWPGALLLVGQRPQRVFSLLAPRKFGQSVLRLFRPSISGAQPKFAAALLSEPQTWRT
jgi:hypothetical protein